MNKNCLRLFFYPTSLIYIGIVLGKSLGAIREIVIAYFFGVSEQADIAILIFTLPDFIVSLFLGSAISAILIPYFQKEKKENHRSIFNSITIIIFIGFSFVSLLLWFGKDILVKTLIPSISSDGYHDAIDFIGGVLCVTPIVALSYLNRAFLHSRFKYFIVSLDSFFNNSTLIMCMLIMIPLIKLKGVVYATIISALVYWIVQVVVIFKEKSLESKPKKKFINLDKSLLKSYLEAIASGYFYILMPIVARSMGSFYFGEGAVSMFNYYYRFAEMPSELCIVTAYILFFPKLSKLLINKNYSEESYQFINRYIKYLFFVSTVLSFSLIFFFFRLLHMEKAFFYIPTESMSLIYSMIIVSLFFFPIKSLSSSALVIMHSMQDTKTPLIINTLSFLAVFPAVIFSIKIWGILGLSCGIAIVLLIQFILNLIMLIYKYNISILNYLLNMQTFSIILIQSTIYIVLWILLKDFSLSLILNFSISALMALSCLYLSIKLDRYPKVIDAVNF